MIPATVEGCPFRADPLGHDPINVRRNIGSKENRRMTNVSSMSPSDENIVARLEAAAERVGRAHKAAASVIFGQDVVIERTLMTILSGGHALLIGVPGLAKTLLVEALGKVLGLDAKRIQFTPDLMPSDIIGTEVLEEKPGSRSFRFIAGPVFAQLLMADEINRASPKTQSALLQAMQEHHVTVAGQTLRAASAVLRSCDTEPA